MVLGFLLELGLRTSFWVVARSCDGIYYLCFGSKTSRMNEKIKKLENRINELESGGLEGGGPEGGGLEGGGPESSGP